MTNTGIATRSEMSAEWFTSRLNQADVLSSGSVESVSLEPFGDGVMTNMVRATLTYSHAAKAPTSVLVKFPSDDEGNLGIAQLMGLYELEVRFYQDIAPLLSKMNLPKCYFAQIDEKTGAFTLILEDLSATTQPGTALDTVAERDCSAIFNELAKFQTPLWNSSTLAKFNWLNPSRTLRFYDAIPAFLDPFLKRFGHALDADHITLLETALPQAGKWLRSWKAPSVLAHGEFRAANVLMGATADAPPITIIDFQTVLIGSPGIDPAYFMGASMPTARRRSLERDLIREYHQQLMHAGVSNFNWDACWKSYCECALYGIYLYGGTSSEVEATEQNDQIITKMFRQLADMAIDLEATKLAGLT